MGVANGVYDLSLLNTSFPVLYLKLRTQFVLAKKTLLHYFKKPIPFWYICWNITSFAVFEKKQIWPIGINFNKIQTNFAQWQPILPECNQFCPNTTIVPAHIQLFCQISTSFAQIESYFAQILFIRNLPKCNQLVQIQSFCQNSTSFAQIQPILPKCNQFFPNIPILPKTTNFA